jgi:hypothetical protein
LIYWVRSEAFGVVSSARAGFAQKTNGVRCTVGVDLCLKRESWSYLQQESC